jgi:hypothetical protein
VSQLLNLLLLSPAIPEELLLSEDQKIYFIPENKLRVIMKEQDRETQWEMWKILAK